MSSVLLPPEELEALQSAGAQSFHDDLQRGHHARAVIAAHESFQIGRYLQARGPLDHPVLGRQILEVPEWIVRAMRNRYGHYCWREKSFVKRFGEANPQCAVKSRAAKTTVTVLGVVLLGALCLVIPGSSKAETSNVERSTLNVEAGGER